MIHVYYNILTLLSGWGGGKGVYGFFSFILGFLLLTTDFLNLGKNLSHDSFLSAGSFISSRFIISVYYSDDDVHD